MRSRNMNIAIIAVLLIICVILISVMIIAILNKDKNYKLNFIAVGDKTKLLMQNEYAITDVGKIEIDTGSSDVKFIEGRDDKIKVRAYGIDGEEYKMALDGNTLKIIKERSNYFVFAFFIWARQEVVVEIPYTYSGDIEIRVTSGNTEVIDLENSNIQVMANSGNVRCGNMKNVDIQTSSGNIRIGNAVNANLKANSRKYSCRKYRKCYI